MKSIYCHSLFPIAGIALILSSCSTGGRSPSGFLSNYSQMDAGYGTTNAVSSYLKPGVDLKKYDSVMIDPVTTVVATPGIGPEVKDQLAAYLGDSMRSQLAGKMNLVGTPGPTTLRIRMALTDVLEKHSGPRPVTTVHANPTMSLTGKLGSDALAAFISNVSFEGEMLDSVTGERLTALCDHRIGSKREATANTSWAGVRSATNQGAAKLSQRLMAARGQ
jgi:hypothetical protein